MTDIRTKPQGLFSTPFAEIPMKPQWPFRPLSKVAWLLDVAADRVLGHLLQWATWNVVVAGRRPDHTVACNTGEAWANS